MGDVDRYYEAKYQLPNCAVCDQDMLCYNTYKVYKVALFCANDECPAFVKTFWVEKKELLDENRD